MKFVAIALLSLFITGIAQAQAIGIGPKEGQHKPKPAAAVQSPVKKASSEEVKQTPSKELAAYLKKEVVQGKKRVSTACIRWGKGSSDFKDCVQAAEALGLRKKPSSSKVEVPLIAPAGL